MPQFPSPSVEYAEQLLARSLVEQNNSANFFGNGALTAISVLLAGYSLIFTLVLQKSGPPAAPFLFTSIALVLAAGALMALGWYLCNMGRFSDPVQAAEDLLTRGTPVDEVRLNVVRSMLRTFDLGRIDLARVQLLLSLALAVAVLGVSVFLYGFAQ